MKISMRAVAALLAVGAMTAGCGGGGGEDAGPAPTSRPITANTAAAVAALATGNGEAVVTVAQFAVDATRRFALSGTPSPSVSTCPNGGLLTVTLSDRDGDGAASPGDGVTLDARDCAVPVITDVVNGKVKVELGTPTGLPPGSLRATVDFGDGLRFGDAGAEAVDLLGSFRLDWSSTALRTTLHVTASVADDLRVVGHGTGGVRWTEAIRQPDLAKTLKFDEARSEVAMSYRYDSQAMSASLIVTTPEPLRSYLNTYPEIGRVEVTAVAGGKVVVTPNFVSGSDRLQYTLDTNGDGVADANGGLPWTESTTGYLWWDGVTPLNGTVEGVYTTRNFSTTDFSVKASFEWTTATDSTYRLQFSRPLAATTPTVQFRFSDQGASPYDAWSPYVDVAATAERTGAVVVVRPATPLRHGRRYVLWASLDGVNWNSDVTVQDTLGNSTTLLGWYGAQVVTPTNLKAVATAQTGMLGAASDQLSLSATDSITTQRPIVGYQWSQLSGAPLRFGDAAAARTTVSWGATPPTGVERATVRLTVTDAAGDSDVTDVEILSSDLGATNRVLYFHSTPGDYIGGGKTGLLTAESAQFQHTYNLGYLRASTVAPGHSEWWSLDLASADGSPLQVGAYESAVRAAFRNGRNGIDFSGSGRGCNEQAGRFDVLEIQTDGAGAITKLAVDFEQHCENATAPALYGSFRLNSSVPIRR